MKKKKTSKRLTLHQKYKIIKKVNAHNREQRRQGRKNALAGKNVLKKDPGLPALFPFKAEMLEQLERQKQQNEEEKARQKQARLKEQMKRRNITSIVEAAQQSAKEFEEKQALTEKEDEQYIAKKQQFKENSKKQFYKDFKKVVEIADVILEVLDARDPLGCRCKDVEEKILAKDPNKKIILVLNKVDLIPKENVLEWLKYFRNELPCIAFKCTTHEQKRKLGRNNANIKSTDNTDSTLPSSECLGADTLLQLLKNYSRSSNMKKSISVGIIGYPNVGKSSLINSLKRSKAAKVGASPGVTRSLQEVQLDSKIKLVDCPGIVFGSSNYDIDIVLRNVVKIDQIADPIPAAELILKRCRVDALLQFYKIPKFETTTEFLLYIAKKRGKIGKGAIPDLNAAAKSVLHDWNGGKIPFYTVPPARDNVHVSAAIVSSWGKEFDIDSILKQEESEVLANLKTNTEMIDVVPMTANVQDFKADQKMWEDQTDGEEDDDDEDFEDGDDDDEDLDDEDLDEDELDEDLLDDEELEDEDLDEMEEVEGPAQTGMNKKKTNTPANTKLTQVGKHQKKEKEIVPKPQLKLAAFKPTKTERREAQQAATTTTTTTSTTTPTPTPAPLDINTQQNKQLKKLLKKQKKKSKKLMNSIDSNGDFDFEEDFLQSDKGNVDIEDV